MNNLAKIIALSSLGLAFVAVAQPPVAETVPADGWYALELEAWRNGVYAETMTLDLYAAERLVATFALPRNCHTNAGPWRGGRPLRVSFPPRKMAAGSRFEVRVDDGRPTGNAGIRLSVRRENVIPTKALYALGDRWARCRFTHAELGGEIDRRVMGVATNNFILSDVEADWTSNFVHRLPADPQGKRWKFVGAGMVLDGGSRMARYSGDTRVEAWLGRLRDGLLAAQDKDGYLGTFVAEPNHAEKHNHWIFHDMEYITMGMLRNAECCGSEAARRGAFSLADFIFREFPKTDKERLPDVYGMGELMAEFYRLTGDRKYRDFIAERPWGSVMNSRQPMTTWSQSFTDGAHSHLFGLMSRCLAQIELYRIDGLESERETSRKALDLFYGSGRGAMTVAGNCGQRERFVTDQRGDGQLGETCATGYIIRWLDSLLRLEGDFTYGDMMERSIWNALFGAGSPDGRWIRYFTAMSGWRSYYKGWGYCCPGNYRRSIGELPELVAYRNADGALAMNLYAPFDKTFELGNGRQVKLACATEYPSEGRMTYTFGSDAPDFALALRIPKWAKGATVSVNGGAAEAAVPSANRLCTVRRDWKKGDTLVLDLPMRLRYVYGREAQRDRVAFLRGPLVFGVGRAADKKVINFWQTLGGWTVDPATAVVSRDDTVRPGGVKFTVDASSPDGKKSSLVFTEFADPTLSETYFRLDGFREDELFDRPW